MDRGAQTNTWEITSEGKPIDVHEVNAEEEQLAEEETSIGTRSLSLLRPLEFLDNILLRVEESLINKGVSSVDFDDFSEEVSDCSMENNRSGNSSPVSSLEEKLAPLPEGEAVRSTGLT